MLDIRKAGDREQTKLDWLDSRHSFSFSPVAPSPVKGPGVLRVINEDRIQPDTGFPEHPHRDMEIISYVLSGVLAHKDTLGNVTEVRAGEVQRMTAGTGIRHSEFNPKPDAANHFLQIWIAPSETGLPPGYEQTYFSPEDKAGRLKLIASPDGRDGSITLHQQAELFAAVLAAGDMAVHRPAANRQAWVQVAGGGVSVNGTDLSAGDGLHLTGESEIAITGQADGGSELLVFDLPS